MNLLIVEDNKELIDSLQSSLEGEGFVVDAVEDGDIGLRKARTHDYDLIILDIGLPHIGGREICKEIRSLGKNVPILMLSVKGEVENKVELLDLGADDYLTKPFVFDELLARLKALLRRPSKIEHSVLGLKGVVVDIESRTVKCDEKEVHLTPKEFALLEYLLRNRGRVLSREEILEHVWDINADPFTNTIETHVLNLRKKLRKKKDLIQTIPGFGYKIE